MMMSEWLEMVETELGRAQQTQNPGRVRTVARRIAGIAIQELRRQSSQDPTGEDYLRLLNWIAQKKDVPPEVAGAAQRLGARLSEDFTSPSVDPLGDAIIIVGFVKRSSGAL